ncbi:unnamed protein product [Dibothriocephalus latus]|uniref:Uncharacterized protein n=1 Tax=Dibothriocephalus latus TaxID=60516 RepID=A0A3P6UY45_DIBLA|nr:unnamed protein product [Dibothriocephalus latus]
MSAIRRTFVNLNIDIFGKIYQTFVRPHPEYAIQAWRPWLQKDKGIIEGVQRRATKAIHELKQFTYERRENNRGDLIAKLQLLRETGMDVKLEDLFQTAPRRKLRRHDCQLKEKLLARCTVTKHE